MFFILQWGAQRSRQEILDRQRFYSELNDVQAERTFIENVMKLGKHSIEIIVMKTRRILLR